MPGFNAKADFTINAGSGDASFNVDVTYLIPKAPRTETITIPKQTSPEECAKRIQELFTLVGLTASTEGATVTVDVNDQTVFFKLRYWVGATQGTLDIDGPK